MTAPPPFELEGKVAAGDVLVEEVSSLVDELGHNGGRR